MFEAERHENLFHRVSIRRYEDRPVEDEKIRQILKAAFAAPSAGNQQPWEFYVVRDQDTIAALSEVSPYAGCLKKAPWPSFPAIPPNASFRTMPRSICPSPQSISGWKRMPWDWEPYGWASRLWRTACRRWRKY